MRSRGGGQAADLAPGAPVLRAALPAPSGRAGPAGGRDARRGTGRRQAPRDARPARPPDSPSARGAGARHTEVFLKNIHDLDVRKDMRRPKTWDFADQNETDVERLFKLPLVVLCEYVLGDAEYLLLGEPGHVALSNSSVSVAFQYVDGANRTLWKVSVLLVEASTNRTVATKHLLAIQVQGTLEFECFHFKEAGDYWFTMSPDAAASRPPAPRGEKSTFLQVEWPVFHVDLNRTSQAAGGALRVGLFTPQPLCPFPGDRPGVEVDVTVRSSLPGASARQGRPLETRSSQRTALAQSQWVEVTAPRWAPQPRSPRCCGSWARLGHYRRGCW
ncbi:thrombospondin type-1 domain-containing protein 1-like [Dasypus novemcinctus]|uniref:thrombospondin type-1 domain-containing protein 1-like n=1 Tax=Dasypus novemcinctus TaxID=9361 RepID=UPI00265F31CA|nr:thrombospondin type-1 domain-containing protein 1-like [Dasypus novemcinctus]